MKRPALTWEAGSGAAWAVAMEVGLEEASAAGTAEGCACMAPSSAPCSKLHQQLEREQEAPLDVVCTALRT